MIQVLLGHAKLETTALYTRVAVSTIRDVKSPLDGLKLHLSKQPPPGPRPHGAAPGSQSDRSPGVADVFRAHGAAWRKANAGRVSLDQLKVMSAIETCRTAALSGHVERCEDCAHELIAYNSCLMGASGNGELACRNQAICGGMQRSFSPLQVGLAPPSARSPMADHERGRACWRPASRHRRCGHIYERDKRQRTLATSWLGKEQCQSKLISQC